MKRTPPSPGKPSVDCADRIGERGLRECANTCEFTQCLPFLVTRNKEPSPRTQCVTHMISFNPHTL